MNELFQPMQEHAPHAVPFMLAAVGATPAQINKTRLIESFITAVVSGAVIALAGYLFAIPVLEEKLLQVRKEVVEVKESVSGLRLEVKENRVRTDLDARETQNRIQRVELDAARRSPRSNERN